MEWLVAIAACLLIAAFFLKKFVFGSISSSKLPPGPFQWPIIGCLPLFPFRLRHRKFYELSTKYGPIYSLPIGSCNIFIIHGKQLAMEMLKTRDSSFCSRPLSMTGKFIGFEHSDPNLCPLNDNWRVVRKAFSNELMSPSRLNSQAPLRREEVLKMINSIKDQCQLDWLEVNLRKVSEGVVTSIMMRMLFGNKYIQGASSSPVITQELKENFEKYLTEGNCLWGELNLVDYFPILTRLDIQGLQARFKELNSKLELLFQMIIEDHKQKRNAEEEEEKDVIDVLLQNNLSDMQIMGIIADALIPGISTTSAAIEWAMAELAANPHTLVKAQEEMDRVVGKSRLMNETDVPSLPYLQGVAKEVLRMHPSAPLDDPHLNEEPATLGGYIIPAQSTVFLNLWALGRDPDLWKNPSEFNPGRFVGSDIGVSGTHFELLPFSSGRRRCPAHALAMIKMQHVVGTLVHAFDWSSRVAIDLMEGDGIVASPRRPLALYARPRLVQAAYSVNNS